MKEKCRSIAELLMKYGKFLIPLTVMVVVAVVVVLVLGAVNPEKDAEEESVLVEPAELVQEEAEEIPQIELVRNEDGALYTLMATYYNALANSDVETVKTISSYVEETESIRIQELGKYIATYPLIEVYTKPGPEEGSYIAYVYTEVTFEGYEQRLPGLMTFYVCTRPDGSLYLNEGEVTEDVLDYIKTVNLQDDVVELNNKVNAQYNDVMMANKPLFDYLVEMEKLVKVRIGEILAEQLEMEAADEDGGEQSPENGQNENDSAAEDGSPTEGEGQEAAQQPQAPAKVYGVATTTVNVRKSDSQQADKLGKLPGAAKVQVLEQKANGWSKVLFEGQEGYVKSEYLTVESQGDAAGAGNTGAAVIRTVTATTNVNMRKEPSETASRICVVVGGESLDVLSESGEWLQVRYSGKVGYVKAEFTQ